MDTQLLHLMRLVSPALPVGAFAYSQGLESAIEQQWVTDETQTSEWVKGVLINSISQLDLPALYWQMQHIQAEQLDEFKSYNNLVFSYRETSELRLESHQMGLALLRLLKDTSQIDSEKSGESIVSLINEKYTQIDWVSAFSLAAASVGLSERQALLGFAWAWLETQIAAAIKLVPLGQTQGQRLLIQLTDSIAEIIDNLMKSIPEKDNIGSVSPNLVILSSQHETQYSRLFRS